MNLSSIFNSIMAKRLTFGQYTGQNTKINGYSYKYAVTRDGFCIATEACPGHARLPSSTRTSVRYFVF